MPHLQIALASLRKHSWSNVKSLVKFSICEIESLGFDKVPFPVSILTS